LKIFRFIKALMKFIFTGGKVSKERYTYRENICNLCSNKEKNICGICGCVLKYKLKWSTEECPLEKW